MAARNMSSNRDHHSAVTSHPPLPPPGNNVRPRLVPLWEREFCRSAYKITWETFCENKRLIEFSKNVLEWDDSGALKSFLDAKERFRAKYHGEAYEDPAVLDPDMYIDEVDHQCEVDPELIDGLDDIAGAAGLDDLVTEVCWWGGMGNGDLVPEGWGEPYPDLVPTGWGDSDDNVTPPHCSPDNTNNNKFFEGGPSSNQQQQQQGAYPGQRPSGTGMNLTGGGRTWNSGTRRGGAMRWTGGGGGRDNGGARHWNRGGGGRSNWNGGGRGNQRNQGEVQHQQRGRGGGTQRNRNQKQKQNEVQHQMRSGGRQQQQGQTQRGKKKEWRPVQCNRAPKDDPSAAA